MCLWELVSFKLVAEGKIFNQVNVDKTYPDSVFTVVITNKSLEKLNLKIEDMKDKYIYINVKVTTFENNPKQMQQIFNPTCIEIKKD